MKLLAAVFLLVPIMSRCSDLVLPLDCSDIQRQNTSGVYTIYPIGATSAVLVFCDMDSLGGKWTVFQRRMDGSVNFYRPWDQYRSGFGNAVGEYWLGLESLFHLTQRKSYELLVDMEDFEGNKAYARYSSFSIGPESDGYRLHVSGFTNGGAGDSLTYHSEQKFVTFDLQEGNCARGYQGAFWYKTCHYANPNGAYLWGPHTHFRAVGVEWFHWKGYEYSLKAISMKIRPLQ